MGPSTSKLVTKGPGGKCTALGEHLGKKDREVMTGIRQTVVPSGASPS